MKVTSIAGVKVYDLSQGKAFPTFLSERARRKLERDPQYNRRVEILQDFSFPAYSRSTIVSRDGRYILSVGGYKPQLKMFDVAEVSLKFERHVDSDIVKTEFISDDYSKFVLLDEDRTISFHAKFGVHHTVKIPTFGRDLAFDRETCDLFIANSGRDIFRFNLSEGRYRASWETMDNEGGNNCVVWNKSHRLVTAGGEDGVVRIWDPRSRTQAGVLHTGSNSITALANSLRSSLHFVVGDEAGLCKIFDLRSSSCLGTKEHKYSTKITSICFGGVDEEIVISSDEKQIKGWKLSSPDSNLFNIEYPRTISHISIAPWKYNDVSSSGLIFASGDCERVMSYFVPTLGPAPIWARYLESLTEELEEKSSTTYEDYRFVTKEELEDLGLSQLIGSSQLRPWMHGYFILARTFDKLKLAANPDTYKEWKKEKIAKKKAERIVLKEKVKINPEMENTIQDDDRFKMLLEDEEFTVDKESKEYKQMFPSGRRRKEAEERGDFKDKNEDEDESDDDDDRPQQPLNSKKFRESDNQRKKQKIGNVRSFLDDEEDDDTGGAKIQETEEEVIKRKVPLSERMKSKFTPLQEETGNMSITFIPKSSGKKKH